MRELNVNEMVAVSGGVDGTLTLPRVPVTAPRRRNGPSGGGGYGGGFGPVGPTPPPPGSEPDIPELEVPEDFENHCPDASPDDAFIGLDVDFNDDGSITVTAEVNGFFDIGGDGSSEGDSRFGPAEGPRSFTPEQIEALGGTAAFLGSLSTFTKGGAIS